MEQFLVFYLDEWEIFWENIVLNCKFGEGVFGVVCGGEVIGFRGEGEWVLVVVKFLKIGFLFEDKVQWLILLVLMVINIYVFGCYFFKEIVGESKEIYE